MSDVAVTPRVHSELGASNAARWMGCHGWPEATRDLADVTGPDAIMGTAAHVVGEQCLRLNCDADRFLGQLVGGIMVTPETVTSVQTYLDACQRVIDVALWYKIEHPVSLAAINPPTAMYGTADFVALTRRRELHVIDYKNGAGVWVAARDNPQMLYYALAAALAVDGPINKIVMTIVQPRVARGDPVRSAVTDVVALTEWSFVLLKHARAALKPNAPRVAGDWCKFCRARNDCPARRAAQLADAVQAFSAVPY